MSLTQGFAKKTEKSAWEPGLHAYTFRVYTFMETVQKSQSLGLKYIELYNGQRLGEGFDASEKLDFLNTDKATRNKIKKVLKDHGLTTVAIGVFSPRGRENWTTTFKFAKSMKIKMINSEPAPEDIPIIDRLASKYKIKVAIHNRPEPSPYSDPQAILNIVGSCGPYIGVCADIGHWIRSGMDPVECIRKMKGHIFSLYLKDLNAKGKEAHDVPWGTGICPVESILKELKEQKYNGFFPIRYEYNWTSSIPDIQQSIDYFYTVRNSIFP